ncbi:MAG: TPM domain-containing protein [Bacteroidales bacterium]|jgi:uncharacterized protein|nr:TPM domain-containing protein [Bacteroidales bacterium]NLM92987.1 TPM domain-containing protein [Bacteroidales bacterium]
MKNNKALSSLFSGQTLVLLFLLVLVTLAGALPPPPDPPSLVVDYSGLLNGGQRMQLEMKLHEYSRVHGTQISVVTIDDLEGLEPADFADRLAEAWGVGQKGRENGVMILVNPSEDRQHGQMHITVGYGLEGVIPDITARRIVDREIIPHFREGRYYEGLDQATTVLMQLASGEFPAEEYNQSDEVSGFAVFVFFLLFILFIILISRKRNDHYNPGKGIPAWTWLWLLSNGSRGNQGSWGDFSGGRGTFGGGSFGGGFGGGFGGFGGGSFGGGGAGGSW